MAGLKNNVSDKTASFGSLLGFQFLTTYLTSEDAKYVIM